MQDALGDRMKTQYERATRHYLPRRTYSIIRLDGKAFHTWTKGLAKPYDLTLMSLMALTTTQLCREIENVVLGYTQSDEISLLMCDFKNTHTQAWFDGNIQKIASVAASICTAFFNMGAASDFPDKPLAFFDARVFTIPDSVEVYNYFVWRQKDCTRNSISLAAQAHFSHKQLHGLNTNQMQEKLFQEAGVNWSDYPDEFKNGIWVRKVPVWNAGTISNPWKAKSAPIFTQTDDIHHVIPSYTNMTHTVGNKKLLQDDHIEYNEHGKAVVYNADDECVGFQG